MSRELTDVSTALEGVVAQLAPSLVSVASHRMLASGFVWRAGLVVTSNEGLAEDGEVRVTLPGGEAVAARIAGRDPTSAIALLRVERPDLRSVALAADIPAAGALVVAAGAEAGAPTAALGLLSVKRGPWQSMRGGEIDARIELDMRLRRTAEGGLAVNAAGQAFGMTGFRASPARAGDPRAHHQPGSSEPGDAWTHSARLPGPRPATGDGRRRRLGRHGDERRPQRSGRRRRHPSGRCAGRLGRQARRQAAAVAEIAGPR